MRHLRIVARVLLLSELDIDAKEPRLSVEVCKKLGAFIPNLSVFDLLFNCGPKAHNIISEGSRNHVEA